jgi:hypothetical protein
MVRYKLVLALLLGVGVHVAAAQTSPLVIAWQAPDNTTQCPPLSGVTCFHNFVTYELPSLSGIGASVLWASIDECTANGMSGGQSAHCTEEVPDTDDQCPPNSSNYTNYYWCALDQVLVAYITNSITSFVNKKIILIIQPVNDQNANNSNFTPPYVFTASWAGSNQPQDMVVCGGWKGNIQPHTGCPVQGSFGSANDFAIWNASNCTSFTSPHLNCVGPPTCNTPFTNISGVPVVYETPFRVAYQDFLTAFVHHYSATGSPNGRMIAPYIAYVRVGLAHAGENSPPCATTDTITQDSWGVLSTVPAGYLVNSGNSQYLAIGAGQIGTAMPNCSPAGCTTAADGSIPGWYNAGQYTPGAGVPIWPGPNGQFGTGAQPQGYWDNGYLTVWPAPPISTGGTGYVTSMLSFLNSLGASFPFDISAHSGPPSNGNTAYADSEAAIASAYGVGFGMQSVNVGDPQSYAALNVFPSTREDWAHNFQAYPAPVRHLQTNAPGSGILAEGFNIDPALGIVVVPTTGVATINCTADCTPLAG